MRKAEVLKYIVVEKRGILPVYKEKWLSFIIQHKQISDSLKHRYNFQAVVEL